MRPTGSSLQLLRACQWWARPEVEGVRRASTAEMSLGSEIHDAIDVELTTGEAALVSAEVAGYVDAWREWWATRPLADGPWLSEVAFAYDPKADTARRLVSNGHRDYGSAAPHEITGTIDAVFVGQDSAVVVDWKTGNDWQGFTADAEDNAQLRFYALCVARAARLDEVRIVVARITTDGVRTTEYVLDALELDAVAAELATLTSAVPASQPQPGQHCGRCNAVAVCPTTVAATEALAPVAAPGPVALTITSPEQATAALLRLRQVQAACEAVETVVKAYAEANGGIALPSGKRWTKVGVDRESINLTGPDMAAGVAAISMAGAEKAIEAKATTSKAAIERELKASGLKGKELRERLDALYGDLRAAGVLRSVTVDAWREV